MICSGWPFTTLANPPHVLVGRGSHFEGHMGDWKGREGETVLPFLHLMYAHLTNTQLLDSVCPSTNLILVGFQTTPTCWNGCFLGQPTNRMPLSANALLICMKLGACHYNIYTQAATKERKCLPTPLTHVCSLVQCPLFTNSAVDLTADNSALLALSSTGS